MSSSTRVFWPRSCLPAVPGGQQYLLIGWNNPEGDLVIVAALPHLDVDFVTRLLNQNTLLETRNPFASSYGLRSPIRSPLRCSKNSTSKSPIRNPLQNPLKPLIDKPQLKSLDHLYSKVNQKRLEIVGSVNAPINLPHSIRVETAHDQFKVYDSEGRSCLLILFDPPNPRRMHYFTLERTKLYEPLSHPVDVDAQASMRDLAFHVSPNAPKHDNWDAIVAQLNCVYELQPIIIGNGVPSESKAREGDVTTQAAVTSSSSEAQHSEAHFATVTRRKRKLSFSAPKKPLLQAVMTVRGAIELGLRILETAWLRNLSLISLFCSAQQADLRLNQLCYLPHEYMSIVTRTQKDWHWLTPDRNEAYIRFNNYIWLGINDLIFGAYFCSLINANANVIENLILSTMHKLCLNSVAMTQWLMKWPAGFKLNTQLAQFMGDVTIWIVVAWYWCLLQVLRPGIVQALVACLAFSGYIGGATFQISLVIDILSVLSFHLYLMYQLLARVYSQQCSVLLALFRLFRGKKYNVLRHRVDHGNYDVHQLLLGTIMFTVLLFLLPTIFAFYAAFAVARLAVLGVVGLLGMTLALLNYFPLFPLLLRIKSPRRLPSGIQFELVKPPSMTTQALYLKTKSMRLSEIFRQYLDTTSQFVRDVFSASVLQELCTGGLVNIQQSKLYASLYSVLPSRRGTAQLLYAEVNEYLAER